MYSTDAYNKSMRVTILPKTPLGKWSTGFIGAFVVFFVTFILIVTSGQRGDDTFDFSNPVLIPMLLAGVSGMLAFLTGLSGVIRNKERSILVFLAMLIGLYVLVFGLGEIISIFFFPH
jgi:LytS/YehU family sensor histidine kinase